MTTILLTHPPQVRENYYSDKALAGLKALAEVRRNPLERELSTAELIAAARGCEIIVTHRHVPGDAELFASLPGLVAFCRCAIDIRNVDVAAASGHGVLVTQASAGFIPATAEWVLGAMIDLGRRISISTEDYHAGKIPASVMGRQLKGATLGVIGYGQIGRYLCDLGVALGMRVLVSDPYAKVANAALAHVELPQLLAESDFVACLALATEETENLMDAQAFAQMKAGRLLRQCFARQSGGRSGAAARARRRTHRRLRNGCRPRRGSDAVARARAPSAGDRHAAHRRAHAAGNRASGVGDRGAGCRNSQGPRTEGGRQCGASHTAREAAT